VFDKIKIFPKFKRETTAFVWAIVLMAVSSVREVHSSPAPVSDDISVRLLSEEVRDKGWIVFCGRSDKGDWDLFLCRPDGSGLHNITKTSEYNEAAPQFSRDGHRLLYRRLPRDEQIDGNHYGAQGALVIANSNGTDPRFRGDKLAPAEAGVFGENGEYPWASWSPDGRQIACLSIEGVYFDDIASRQIVRRLNRKGFFQQLSWSPDGKWLCGVANSFGTGWSVARMNALTGDANAVSRVDCCTPDWFPDSKYLVFSNRPPGQKANNGYGWTQLWMADVEGTDRKLVYAEEGRHVYGGHVSPDGRYVIFTGNIQENGDPGNVGALMGLMRLADMPVIGGQDGPRFRGDKLAPAEAGARSMYPNAKSGPALKLPVGWEPCWTFPRFCGDRLAPAREPAWREGKAGVGIDTDADLQDLSRKSVGANTRPQDKDLPAFAGTGLPLRKQGWAEELRSKGWIVFSAATGKGDWDLFLMRPDGSDRRQITDTRNYNEAGARFSPDGKKLLYYRLPNTEQIDNNTYGTYELVVADSNGRNAVVYGNRCKWASWGPDGTQIASLDTRGIQIIDLATRRVVRELPRRGVVQQLVWSPDGKWFVGTANGLGVAWAIGRLNAETGQINAVSEIDRYNCTPDWLGDSQRIIYSRGIVPDSPGWAELWVAGGDGSDRRLLYAEDGRHIYGGCVSPDGRYVLFTRSEEDLGKVDNSQTTMAIIRWEDAHKVGRDSVSLRAQYPDAQSGPLLDLSYGWEPHWTYSDVIPAANPGVDVTDSRK
jgi:Tol biopolymer transport system component